MADMPITRETQNTRIDGDNEPIGRVNVYDVKDTPDSPVETPNPYAPTSEPATRTSPALMTWFLVLVAVILALYFVVQVLT